MFTTNSKIYEKDIKRDANINKCQKRRKEKRNRAYHLK